MRTLRIAAATLLTFGLFLLQLPAETLTPNSDRYLLLEEGMQWVLDARLVTKDKKEHKGVGLRTIGAVVEREGKKYHTAETAMEIPGLPPFNHTELVRKDSNAFYSIMLGASKVEEEMDIPLPMKVGATWETKYPYAQKHSIVSLETVTIGDKVYKDCFKIRSQGTNSVEHFWEAPVVGVVKSETELRDGTTIIMTLNRVVGIKGQGPLR